MQAETVKTEGEMRKVFIAATAGLALAGCNTVEGFGQDLSATGHAISGAARETRSARPSQAHRAQRAPCPANPSHSAAPAVC